jgi:hypothetical protein
MSDVQREVEKDLFEEHNKILDRFSSLIFFIFFATCFSFIIITFTTNKENTTIKDAIADYNIICCFIFLFVAFLISCYNLIEVVKHNRLVNKVRSIEYWDGDELVKHNIKLYSAVKNQKDDYAIVIGLIAISFVSLYSYFAQIPNVYIILVFFLVGLLVWVKMVRHI